MSALAAARSVLARDLRRARRRPGDLAQPLIFFAVVVFLFPIAIGPQSELLRSLLPAMLWVAALLALVITLPDVFAADYADGSLEQLILSPQPLALLVLAKVAAQWLTGALPLIGMSAALGAVLGLEAAVWRAVMLGLLLGTPVLSLVGGLASALAVGLRGGPLLLALLTLPLYIPVLIFGTSAARNAGLRLAVEAEMLFLAGLSVLALTLTPFAIAAALRARMG